MPKERSSIRIVVDVNVWISIIIGKKASAEFWQVIREETRIFFSLELLDELLQALSKPRLKKFLTQQRVVEFLSLLPETVDFIEHNTITGISRDPKDDYLLALSGEIKADYLITGDKDLLVLKTYKNTRIVTLTEFLNELKK